ncbi:tryptophan-rich sensory protein [Candidatus Micrarchaeota archaeon]|nr:tryptophan-rich sensory protein [Candidatus Micrarchaeota archaeon]
MIVFCELVGIIGSFFTAPSITSWYAAIQKPFFTPPNWVFAPVWTTLFLLMGISLYLVWEKGLSDRKVRIALSVFGIQLILNIVWSLLFFGLQNPFLAFIEIILLWISILATIILFYRISVKASILLIPYIVWVSIAALLNYSVWILNP